MWQKWKKVLIADSFLLSVRLFLKVAKNFSTSIVSNFVSVFFVNSSSCLRSLIYDETVRDSSAFVTLKYSSKATNKSEIVTPSNRLVD